MRRTGLILVALLCWLATATPTATIDGDTFDADVRVWMGWGKRYMVVQERVRLLGVNTPERKAATLDAYDKAKAFTAGWLLKGDVTLRACQRDFNGRALATVTRDGEDLAELLIVNGLGVGK